MGLKKETPSYGFGSSKRPALNGQSRYEIRPDPGQYHKEKKSTKGFSMPARRPQ